MRRSLRYGTLIFREFRRTNEGIGLCGFPAGYPSVVSIGGYFTLKKDSVMDCMP